MRTKLDLMRFYVPISGVSKNQVLGPRMEDGRVGHDQPLPQRQLQAHVDIHAGPQFQSWVWENEPNWQRPCGHVQLRQQVVHFSSEYLSWVGVHRDLGWIARF